MLLREEALMKVKGGVLLLLLLGIEVALVYKGLLSA